MTVLENIVLGEIREEDPRSPLAHVYPVSRDLATADTGSQKLRLVETPGLGRVLFLDGLIQLAERDAYVYHEMLAHPAMAAHPHPRRIAIVGGGDGLLLVEVLRHAVSEVVVLELDAGVVEAASTHLPGVAAAFADPRVHLEIGDAFESLSRHRDLDVILCDLTDPVGAATRLFTDGFYALCERALAADGILAAQTESLHFHRDLVRESVDILRARFAHVAAVSAPMATYPGGWWTITVAGRTVDPRVRRSAASVSCRLYIPDCHSWYFIPDAILDQLLGAPDDT